ncbi:MAG: hypothetical protein HKP32_12985, partial [Woeseia sp.]|nr:hypothetical protein [Woeseia sp.]
GALDAINAAIGRGYSKTMLRVEPYLADLHGQGRFVAMLTPDNAE